MLRHFEPVAAGSQPAPVAGRLSGAVALGIDLECADDLPWSGDPWSDPFYVENFGGAEIAWCLRQADPRLSFCGLWSAKEAARKCDPTLAGLRPSEIEIAHDRHGRPGLQTRRAAHQGLGGECVLSISHSGRICVAVCVKKLVASPFPDAKLDYVQRPPP